MPLIEGIDQPVRDNLADLTQAAQAGICLKCDPRGIPDDVTLKRYGYLVQPTSGTAFMLLRVDLDSRAAELLAAPPAAAGAGAYNTAIMTALFDPNGGAANNMPTLYVLVSLTAAPWAQWMAYDVRTDAWAILAAPACGPAGATPLGTSVSLCHPCTTMGVSGIAGVAEIYIYANGDAGQWGAAGPSRVAQYDKTGAAWAYLTGAGGPRAAAPAAGSKSVWIPEYPGWIFTTRGGAAAPANQVWDTYDFVGNAWLAAVTPVPAISLAEGSELCNLWLAPGMILVRPAGHVNDLVRVCAGEVLAGAVGGAAAYHSVAMIDPARLPAAHASDALIAWWSRGNYYIGAVPYGRSSIKRIQVPTPV